MTAPAPPHPEVPDAAEPAAGDPAEPARAHVLVTPDTPVDTLDPRDVDVDSFDRDWTIITPELAKRPGTGGAATRRLLFAWSRRELRTRYLNNGFRGLWNLVQPVTILLIYSFVFTQIFGADGGGLPYLSMAWAGIVVWQFVQQGVQMGMWSFIYEAGTLPKIWYPRIIIPLTPGTAALADLAVGAVLIMIVAFVQGIRPSITMIALPIPALLVIVWVFGAALIVAPAAVFVRDLTTIIPLAMRLGFFTSPVMYPMSQVPENLQWLMNMNPIAVAITGFRDTMLAGQWPDWNLLGAHLVAAFVLVGLGVLYLRKVENRIVDAL